TAYDFSDNTCIRNLSDNGNWAVSFGTSTTDGSMYANARLINVRTKEVTMLAPDNDEGIPVSSQANDVSDEGIVVGAYKGKPSVWSASEGWRTLTCPDGWTEGDAIAVTPDGRYAVGRMTDFTNGYKEYPVMWDLSTLAIIPTPGYPTVGSAGETANMIRYTGISSDARYIIGTVDFSYTWNTLEFIYDRESSTWHQIGLDADGNLWADGLLSVQGAFSPNVEWFGGKAYITDGTDSGNEYELPFRYNMKTKEFEMYDESEMHDIGTVVVDNEGILYAATPSGTPVRSLYIRSGKFWYAFDELLKQRYGIDFYGKTGYDNTGTAMGVSGDGKTITCFPDPYSSYVVEMNETFAEAASHVNLLTSYTATPADGSSFSKIKSVTVNFTRDVTVLGTTSDILFVDEQGTAVGKVLSLETLTTSSKTVRIGFRTTALEAGKTYRLTIPAGTIALKADVSRTNQDIVFTYTGRSDEPVKLVTVSPEDGTELALINTTTNPILLTFDTNIQMTDTASAILYCEGKPEPVATLGMADKANQLLVYSSDTEYLYLNSDYRVVLGAGSVTDVNGDNANEQFEIKYKGIYERIVMADDTLMYSEDFSGGVEGMMLYDGDKNTPNEEMQGYDFLQAGDNYAWVPVLESVSASDYAAASTSAYLPAGKSDDWMVTPGIYIPDAKCRLEFQAQGFRKAKSDKLKVIVYASERDIHYLTADELTEIRANGEVIMDEVVSPGENEDTFTGDWTTYSFKLDKYAKRNIYVAFVNENEDQSCVFVDNIKVIRDNGFLTALTSPTSVVGLTEQTISGRVIANAETLTFTSVDVQLLDASKKLVDKVSESGLSLAKGDKFDFTFAKPLPLTIGEYNTFYLRVQVDDVSDTVKYTIKDLAFSPQKRVLIEEITGQDCGFCPQGILALENLEKLYGDRIIPACYHTYYGDNLASGMSSYTNDFLKITNAPSAKINRSSTVSSPMYNEIVEGKRIYSFTSPDASCWLDIVQQEFQTEADAEVKVLASYDPEAETVSVRSTVKYAMSRASSNVGIFLIVTEDNLYGYQHNFLYSYTSENSSGLGEWAGDGTLGQEYVPYYHNDVARAHVGLSYYGTTGYIPSSIEGGKEYNADMTFAYPAVSDIKNCKIISVLIDANTGEYINAARSKVYSQEEIDGISQVGAKVTEAVEVGRYDASGRRLQSPCRGINIIRMSDGTVRKVFVK
ncbi:MAG: choice-of-anchor J domain-containing protein, partial [Prevotella sp.]